MARADVVEESDEGYFASISDLMVGILFVFLLMLTVFALNFRDAEDEQKVERSRYEQLQKMLAAKEIELDEAKRLTEIARREAQEQERKALEASAAAERQRAENDRLRRLLSEAVAQLERDLTLRQTARAQLLRSLERSLSERNVRVAIDEDSGILRLAGDLLFRTNESVLQPEARRTVELLADALDASLGCSPAEPEACASGPEAILETVLVEGHTDAQQYKSLTLAQSQEQNDRLSTERALTVFKTLRQRRPGLEEFRNRENLKLLAFSGYGDRRPLPGRADTPEAEFQRNRRIDVRFVLSTRTSDELQRLRDQINRALGVEP